MQRGGSPTAHDRVLATRYGVAAIEELYKGNHGVMVALQGDRIVAVPITDAITQKKVDMDLYNIARLFF